jgi:hypothetical protein
MVVAERVPAVIPSIASLRPLGETCGPSTAGRSLRAREHAPTTVDTASVHPAGELDDAAFTVNTFPS